MVKKIFFLLLGSIFIHAQQNNQFIKQLLNDYYQEKLQLNPISATFNGDNSYNDQLPNTNTKTYEKKVDKLCKVYLKKLHWIKMPLLNKEERLSIQIMRWELTMLQQMNAQPTELLPLDQFNGFHLTMAQLGSGDSAQPFKTIKDYENWLKRLDKYTVWLDSAKKNMKNGVAQNIVLPKVLVEKMIPQFQEMITLKVEDNLFYSPITKMPDTFTEKEKNKLTKKYAYIIEKKIVPAYQSMIDFLQNEYLPYAKVTSGIGDTQVGSAIYKLMVQQWTTTNLSPKEIHEIGLKEVARIRIEMEKVKDEVGYSGDLKDFFNDVRANPSLKPFKNPEEVLANFNAIQVKMKPRLNQLFSWVPKSPFEVRRTEFYREKTASAEYVPGTADGSRPGIFYVPIPDVVNYNYYADEDLFLHEAIPGHHYQISLQQENTELPDFRRYNWFGAYGEGWALYCESLGKELGLYQDPYQYFGMLSNDMLRAVRLVVDTGMHSMGWTREQAIQYSLENEAEPEASIIAEIERYMAFPGQALSYKIGQMKIIELRNVAQNELGANFDIKQYHKQLLESGVMPLDLLEQKINAWILEEKKQRPNE